MRDRITADCRQNVAYTRPREKRAKVENLRISDELNIDLAPDGTVYGIELLNANEQLALGADGKLVFVDEDGGYIADIPTWMATQRLPSDEALQPVELARFPAGRRLPASEPPSRPRRGLDDHRPK